MPAPLHVRMRKAHVDIMGKPQHFSSTPKAHFKRVEEPGRRSWHDAAAAFPPLSECQGL